MPDYCKLACDQVDEVLRRFYRERADAVFALTTEQRVQYARGFLIGCFTGGLMMARLVIGKGWRRQAVGVWAMVLRVNDDDHESDRARGYDVHAVEIGSRIVERALGSEAARADIDRERGEGGP